MGRPPIAKEKLRSDHIKVLVTDAERAELDKAAEAAGKAVSTWVREVALEKARHKRS
jgi:uncharacterized protein (DUF1778 family)